MRVTDVDPLAWLAEPIELTNYDDARVLLTRPSLVVPVLGAGVSVGAGQPTSSELAAEMLGWPEAEGLPPQGFATHDARAVANAFLTASLLEPEVVRTRVVDYLGCRVGEPTALLDHLARIPSLLVVTLNYDLSLEETAGRLEIDCASLVLRQHPTDVIQALSGRRTRERLVVVHLHGSIDAPLDIILDSLAYSQLANFEPFRTALKLLLNNFTLVFMGTRLDEQLLAHELLSNRIGQSPHLFVNNRTACEELIHGRMSITEGSHLVVVRAYPDGDGTHVALNDLAEYLARTQAEQQIPEAPVVPESAERPRFVRAPLIPVSATDEDTYIAFLVAAGKRPAVDEDVLRAIGARAVLVGAPGSGKTTLMREIGASHTEDVHPIMIRLADVGHVGEPSRLLEQWAQHGEGLRSEEKVAVEALDQRIFHFFLDGLDEVSRERQEKLAEKIVQIARLNPAHMFTVASRPTPALDRFLRPEWQHVALSPDGDWQRAFLVDRGLEWEELREELPLVDDLRELLQLPFFLDAVVRLHEAGELAGARDLLDLVGRLIDIALNTDELALDSEAAREWLRDVALAMQLAERAELSVEELAQVGMPEGLAATDSALDVADALVGARLFLPRGDGGYRFIHRIVGEALVAEALSARGPITELMEVVVPQVEDVGGVRADWLVPVTLAATRDERWRIAIQDRDPIAAARTVPDQAPLEERIAAARHIWETYCERRIWIWDYRTPSLVEDADVLARLLRTDGLDAVRAEILAIAGGQEREIRGNAFRVLSLTGDRELTGHLRAVLENSNEEPVMRRVAARAAVTLGLHELYYMIAHRALYATEDVEGQDMTYYALDLARPEELSIFAIRLAAAPSRTAYIALSRVEQDLTPRDQLRFLHAWASGGEHELDSTKDRARELIGRLEHDPEAARELGFVAAAWHLVDDHVREYLLRFPQEGIIGMVDAANKGIAYDYELLDFLSWFSLDEWEAGGAPELVIDWKRREADA